MVLATTQGRNCCRGLRCDALLPRAAGTAILIYGSVPDKIRSCRLSKSLVLEADVLQGTSSTARQAHERSRECWRGFKTGLLRGQRGSWSNASAIVSRPLLTHLMVVQVPVQRSAWADTAR